MHTDPIAQQISCLLMLSQTHSIDAAAKACAMDRQSFMDVLAEAETTYGRPLVAFHEAFAGLTDMGEVVLRCAPAVLGSEARHEAPQSAERWEASLATLLNRRSVSPKRLGTPGPSVEQIELMLRSALAAPDHGSLHPWRTLEFRDNQREALADLFEQEKSRRDPLASTTDLKRAREHATRPPSLLAFIVAPRQRSSVPEREQWLAAGAALGNLLNAAHQLGFGAIILSGERCHDEQLIRELGLHKGEVLAGFISIGKIVQTPPARKPVLPMGVWSCWLGPSSSAVQENGKQRDRRLES